MTDIPLLPTPPPAITAADMRLIDQRVEDLGIDLPRMMENAGRSLALLAVARYRPSSVTVLAGSGGNAGGGLVAARHLANRGIGVSVTLARPIEDLDPVPAHQAAILRRLAVPMHTEPSGAALIIDAVLGYSISGHPRGHAADLIAWANDSSSPVLSLDGPSGLDFTTGEPGRPTVRADATLTLALPKSGLYAAPQFVGDLFLADISVPPSAYEILGFRLDDPFSSSPIVRVPLPDTGR